METLKVRQTICQLRLAKLEEDQAAYEAMIDLKDADTEARVEIQDQRQRVLAANKAYLKVASTHIAILKATGTFSSDEIDHMTLLELTALSQQHVAESARRQAIVAAESHYDTECKKLDEMKNIYAILVGRIEEAQDAYDQGVADRNTWLERRIGELRQVK